MDAVNQKPGLDPVFRNNILNNVILTRLKEHAKDSKSPDVMRKVYQVALNFEKNVYSRATNKDNYIDLIKSRLHMAAKSKPADAPPSHTRGNQLINTVVQKQADVPQVLQKPLPESLPTMQSRSMSMQPYSNQLQQHHQFGHQHVIPSVQQHLPVDDKHSILITKSCQQPSQLSSPSVILQAQRVQIQDGRLQRTHMSSTSHQCRTLVGEDKHSLQSPIISTTPSPGFGSSPDAVDINDPEWKLLIDQYQHAKSRFLPGLTKLSQMAAAEERCSKEKSEKQLKAAKNIKILFNFFTAPESELMRRYPKEVFSQLLKNAMIGCSSTLKKFYAMCAKNQKPQPSDEPIMPTANTALLRNSMISSPGARNPSFGSDIHATKQVDKSLLHQGPERTVDQYAHLNVKKDPRLSQASIEEQPQEILQSRKPQKLPDDPMNSMFRSMSAKPPERVSTKIVKTNEKEPQISLQSRKTQKLQDDPMNSMFRSMSAKPPKRVSTKTVQTKNKSFVLKPSAMSQAKESVLDHSPSTPMTPSSAPKDIGNPSKPPTECLNQVSSAPKEVENPSKQPVERLLQVIQSMSKKALRGSSSVIASAMMAADELPSYAYISQQNMKRNIDSVGGYVSTLDNCGSLAKRSRAELDHSLKDEIREINQRLLQTVVEVDSHSGSDSHNETIIKCTYKPVFFNENLKRHLASMSSLTTLSIKFMVPSCYPNSPPKILDQVPVEKVPVQCCTENIHLMEEARSRFDCRAQSLVSLREMAQAWDDTAHSVISDMAVSIGGETLRSMYGTWECVPAA